MVDVLRLPMRPGDKLHHVTDDLDIPDKYSLRPPFEATEKGTLLIFIDDIENGVVEYEWIKLRV